MDKIDTILAQWAKERPDLDTSAMGPVGRLRRVSNALGREMEKTFAAHDLTPAGFDVLATLRRADPPYALSPGDLLKATMVTSGTMTHRIDLLVKEGLVERIKNPEDGRSVTIALTQTGRSRIDGALDDHTETQSRLLSPLSPTERDTLSALLRKLGTAFE